MVANIRGYTPNYQFKLINFDVPRWHTFEYDNWQMIDSILHYAGLPPTKGNWANSTTYAVGDRVIDDVNHVMYRCKVQHTSAASPTTFAQDRANNPTYWELEVEGVPVFRGTWAPGIIYFQGDIVVDSVYDYWLCHEAHGSQVGIPPLGGSQTTWELIFSAKAAVQACAISETNAANSASAAAISEDNAADSATAAAGSATAAEEAESSAINAADAATAAQGAFRWEFDSSITVSDPGPGKVRFNDAIYANVTSLTLSAYTDDTGNPDLSDWIVTWDDSTSTPLRGTVYFRRVGDPENFVIFGMTGTVTDHGTWLEVGVTYIVGSGGFPNEKVSVAFIRTGNMGASGEGSGDMVAANNLSDVEDVPTSTLNLGLGTTSTPTFAQVQIGTPTVPNHAATKAYADSVADTESDRKVDKLGDTMTGTLVIDTIASAVIYLDKTGGGGNASSLIGKNNGSLRWQLSVGDGNIETGVNNTGSNFSIYNYADNQALIGTPFSINRFDGKVTMTGGLDVLSTAGIISTGDIQTYRSAEPNTGLVFFTSSRTHKYIYYNGTTFEFNTGGGAFTGPITTTVGGASITGVISSTSDINSGGNFSAAGSGTFNNDIKVRRTNAPNTGLLSFGDLASRYLYYDGATFTFAGGGVSAMTATSSFSSIVSTTFQATQSSNFAATGGNTAIYATGSGGASYTVDLRCNSSPSASLIAWCVNTGHYGMVGAYQNGYYSFYGTTNAFIAGGSWGVSDGRLKTITRDADPTAALAAVNSLAVKAFTPSSPAAREVLTGKDESIPADDETLYGWVAQDVEQIIPIAVRDVVVPREKSAIRTAIGRGIDEDATIKAINDRYMLTTLWSAVQRLSTQNNDLMAELEAIKASMAQR